MTLETTISCGMLVRGIHGMLQDGTIGRIACGVKEEELGVQTTGFLSRQLSAPGGVEKGERPDAANERGARTGSGEFGTRARVAQ